MPADAPPAGEPLVFLLGHPEDGTDKLERAAAMVGRAGANRYECLKEFPDGPRRADGVPIQRVPAGEPVELIVSGANESPRLVDRFPARVRVTARPGPRGAFLRVGGHTPYLPPGSTLPPDEAWFLLPPGRGTVNLLVDIDVQPQGDVWIVRRGDGAEASKLSGGPPDPPTPRTLILVFDRTCPDAHRWDEARVWVQEGRAARAEDEYNLSAPDPSAARSGLPEGGVAGLNAEIRRGLADGFRAAAANCPPRVPVVWFADSYERLAPRPRIEERLRAGGCGRVDAPGRAVDLGPALGGLGYAPGLDLWDALDSALHEAREVARGHEPAAVLIVGNSPPHPPIDPDSPFNPILDRRGMRSARRLSGCTVDRNGRTENTDFDAILERLTVANIPTVYLFLTGHRHVDMPLFSTYSTIQNEVRAAIEQYMPVVPAEPTADGVAAGVADALRRLREPVGRVYVHPAEGI